MLGAVAVLRAGSFTVELGRFIDRVANRLLRRSVRGWPWPEPRLTYDNARLPQALILAGGALGDHDMTEHGLSLLEWLIDTERGRRGFSFTPVGGRRPGETGPAFDQQPIEAWGMADALAAAAVDPGGPWLEAWTTPLRGSWGATTSAWPSITIDRGRGRRARSNRGGPDRGAESTLAALGAQRAGELARSFAGRLTLLAGRMPTRTGRDTSPARLTQPAAPRNGWAPVSGLAEPGERVSGVMRFASWPSGAVGPVVATCIHAGHELRPEVGALMAVDDATRLRQEDPHTHEIAAGIDCRVVVHRSRFEVDLNRPRSEAVYRRPGQAWGIEVWRTEPGDDVVASSRRLYDGFYRRLSRLVEQAIDAHGGFVLYDVHSYNHRTAGPSSPRAPAVDNPLVNLGTGYLPARWRPVANAFLAAMRAGSFDGEPVDARENVRFRGGHLSRYVAERYGSRGGALAIEFRKDFMDEWTGQCDRAKVAELSAALAATTALVWEAHLRCR